MTGPVFNPKKLRLTRAEDFGQLYDHFAPRLYRHALIRTNSAEEAEDITAKTFLKAWEYVRARNRIKNIRAFLYRITDNLIIDWYRTRNPMLALSHEHDEGMGVDLVDPHDTEAAIIDSFDTELIKRAMRDLPFQDQTVLMLRFVDDLEIGEIAHVAEKTKGAVTVAIHRALKRLMRTCRDQYGTLA